jgi:L-alanine-DL-glutamate epimerase-like enolase superfamily enzyme
MSEITTQPISSVLDAPIESMDVFRVTVPLPETVAVIGTFVSEREYVIARVYANGRVGTGFGFTRGVDLDRVIQRQIAKNVIGKPVGSIRQIWTAARDSMRMIGEAGIFARALSAVDIALWDLLGQVLDVPLWRLLGGLKHEIPCLAIAGYYRPQDSVGAMRRDAERCLQAGYRDFKVHFGEDLELDVQRIRALREVIGSDAFIALDASAAFDTIKQALDFWRHFETFNVNYLEDPFPSTGWELAMQFARTTDIKIAFGESITSPAILQALGAVDGVDVLRPDATMQMGITGYIQGIAPALENRVEIYPHYFPDIHAPLAAALGGSMIEEAPADCDTVSFRLLRGAQPDIRDGMWYLNDKPGLGIDWDEDALARYRVAGSVGRI